MVPISIFTRAVEDSARVVFNHPYDVRFHRACQALEIRGLISFGKNPIIVPGEDYNAWFADIDGLNTETYGKYAMLVRDFYSKAARAPFDALFGVLDVDSIPRSVHNPDNYMRGNQKLVAYLIEKYRDIAPLEYYGSPFPAEGVALFLKSLAAKDVKGALNGCEPGTGKTRQVVVAFIEGKLKRALVVAPKSARASAWPTEIPLVSKALTWRQIDKKNYADGTAQFDLLSWDELRRMPEDFFNAYVKNYDILIVDEFHRASNLGSQRSQALEVIAEAVPKIWALTGSAVKKRPYNILNLLRLLHHPLVDSEVKIQMFLTRYCGYFDEEAHGGRGAFVHVPQNLDELHDLLKDTMFRWEKSGTSLPPKLRHIVEIPLTKSERIEYDGAWDEFKAIPERAKKMKRRGYPYSVVKAKVQEMAAARIKVPYAIDWADVRIEAGRKVCLYTGNTAVFEELVAHYGKACVGINGATSTKARFALIKRFQEDSEVMVFVGNIVAAGESITLTAASDLAFLDITRLPSEIVQTEDRINRGGATETSRIYYFVCLDTQDERVLADFVQSEEVVKTVTARRDANGNIHQVPWVGPIAKYMNMKKGASPVG